MPFAAKRHLREALRLDPSDSEAEAAFLEADRATRWIYLPMYYWTLLVIRLPGRQFAVWGAVMAFAFLAPRFGLGDVRLAVLGVYLVFAIYTWLALPLVKVWTRLRPPR